MTSRSKPRGHTPAPDSIRCVAFNVSNGERCPRRGIYPSRTDSAGQYCAPHHPDRVAIRSDKKARASVRLPRRRELTAADIRRAGEQMARVRLTWHRVMAPSALAGARA